MKLSLNTRYYFDYVWTLAGGIVLGSYIFYHRWLFSLAWLGLMIFNAWSNRPFEKKKDNK